MTDLQRQLLYRLAENLCFVIEVERNGKISKWRFIDGKLCRI